MAYTCPRRTSYCEGHVKGLTSEESQRIEEDSGGSVTSQGD